MEHSLALHPTDPAYFYPKWERKKLCNKNYYEGAIDWVNNITNIGRIGKDIKSTPVLHFVQEEKETAKSYISTKKFNILWCMSGSGKNKGYPWTEFVIGDVLNNYIDIHFITIGDDKCQLIESRDTHITNLAGKISMRISMCLTKYVDLVITPDTGILHAAGCYDTPKIGLLGHSTIENVTKHFRNDYSIETDCACAPCFKLIYDQNVQCPVEPITKAPWCMSEGLSPERVYEQIREVIPTKYRR